MHGDDVNLNEPPEEYGAEHFDDPLQQEVKEPWYKRLLKNKKMLYILGGVVAAIIVVVLILTLTGGSGTYGDKLVFLEVDGPDAVASGSEVTYRINAINKESVALNDIEVEVIFPEGFTYSSSTLEREDESRNLWNLGKIDANYSVDFEVSGTLTGAAEELKEIRATMRYQPAGIGTEFSREGITTTRIAAGDLVLTIDAPKATSSGNDVEYQILYENRGSDNIDNLYLKVTYPDGFTFATAEPEPVEGNALWKLPPIDGGGKGEVVIGGKLIGVQDETKRVKAELGTVGEEGTFYSQLTREDSTRIMESAVVVTQSLVDRESATDVVGPGEELKFLIEYENLGGVGLRNSTIQMTFSNPDIVDVTKLDAGGGSWDYNTSTITWTSAGMPELGLIQPGDKGEISVRFAIKNRAELPINNVTDKNFQLDVVSSLQSEDLPVSISTNHKVESETRELKVNSYITVDAQGFYYDQFTGEPVVSDPGPMPPRVNQTTKYHITWSVTNLANDLEDAVATVVLAPGVKWENNANVTHGQELEYESRTGKVTWNIGRVPANTGNLGEKMVASFDISITPGADKIDEEVELLQPAEFSAEDTFTGVELKGTDKVLTTKLPDDTFASGKDKVEP